MFKWRVEHVQRGTLENQLNVLEGAGWEIFAVVPTLDFVNTKIVMGVSAPLPQNVEYDIICRRSEGQQPEGGS